MLLAPPSEVTVPPKASLPVTRAVVSELICPALSEPPLHTSVGVPVIAAVSVSPTSRSLTDSVPIVAAMSCAVAMVASATVAPVIAESTGASLVPVIVNFTSCVPESTVPSLTFTA